MRLRAALAAIAGRVRRVWQSSPLPPTGPTRPVVDHVVILDGTMSSLRPGRETNAGLTFRLLHSTLPRADLSLRYEEGIQFATWRQARDVIEGRGIDRQIRRAYGALASRYRPGDRIWLFGYSRGAYAVRSLAGVIDRVGLVRHDAATQRTVDQAWHLYQSGTEASVFAAVHCHHAVEIRMIGVWDTVKALGLRVPVVVRWTRMRHSFHNHALGRSVRHGYHALALDETRVAYAPVMWDTAGHPGTIEQMWFRGTHGDVGGQLDGMAAARPLANIPLVWLLGRAEAAGLALPAGWRDRFPCDPNAPSIGRHNGWARLFLIRRRRVVGHDPSERIHASAAPAAVRTGH